MDKPTFTVIDNVTTLPSEDDDTKEMVLEIVDAVIDMQDDISSMVVVTLTKDNQYSLSCCNVPAEMMVFMGEILKERGMRVSRG